MPKLDKRSDVKQYPLRVPEELLQAFAQAAKAEKRSINAQVELLMERWLAEEQQRQRPAAPVA